MRKLFTGLVTMLLLICSGCTQRLTDFTVISTKNVPIGGSEPTYLKKADRRVTGKDVSHMVLFFPLGSPNLKEAIDRAIEQYPGAIALSDGVVKSHFWWCLFYGQDSYIVEGTPLYENHSVEEIKSSYVGRSDASNTTQTGFQNNANVSSSQQSNESFAVMFYHDVKKGDTLSNVAESYSVNIADIIRWNQLNSSELTPGTKLIIMLKQ